MVALSILIMVEGLPNLSVTFSRLRLFIIFGVLLRKSTVVKGMLLISSVSKFLGQALVTHAFFQHSGPLTSLARAATM